MKSNQVKNGLWKDKVVFFNGFQDKWGNDTWVSLQTKLQFPNGKSKWVAFNQVVWD